MAIALIALAIVAVAIAFAFQRAIGEIVLARMVPAMAGRDATADLPDGLHVALCGTGSPIPDPARAGPCNLVIAGKRVFVVDIGDGSARRLGRMQVPAGRIEGLFLTHFHSDHIDGMGPLMLLRWTGGNHATPLPVYGPEGVQAVVDGFNAAYATDNGYRTVHHGAAIVPPGGGGARAVAFALPAGPRVVYRADGLTVTAFPVDHEPVRPAVGYRFDYKGRSVVFSGDTAEDPMLVRAGKGADLMVHEALQPRMVRLLTAGLEERGQPNTAQITRDILDYHATPEQAAATARKAGVRMLVLSHIVPPIPARYFNPVFLGDAPDRFDGPLVVGEDGMLFVMPAGSDTIQQRRLGG